MRSIKTNEEKFWSKVNKLGPEDCWEWLGAKHPTGYGKLWIILDKRVCKPSHHVSLILSGIHIPEGSVVMHSCDNPSCVNPKHLKVGSQQENIQDKLRKGRQPTGDKHHNTVISDADVSYIRRSKKLGTELAKQFQVSPSVISNIRNFKRRV